MGNKKFDFIVIGGGHQGLAVGAYLAKAGMKTLILERRNEMGGGLSTEEVTLPGFYHNLHSNFHGMIPLMPQYSDLELEKVGVRYFHPEANLGMPLRDGRCLVWYVDEIKTYESIERFSKKDADAYADFKSKVTAHTDEMLRYIYTPPTAESIRNTHKIVANLMGGDVFKISAYDWVKSYFENPHVQALALFHMSIAGYDITQKGLAHPGIGYLAFATNWQLCRGGSHFLAHAVGGVFIRHGGDLVENSPVKEIILDGKRAVGVKTADGQSYYADKAVVSAIDLHQTFLEFLPSSALDADFRKKVEGLVYGRGDSLFGIHLALKKPPVYTSAKYNPDINMTFNLNIGYETPEDVLEHFEETNRNELPKHPRLNVSVNTLFDATQAPKGFHTGLMWQFAPYEIGDQGAEHWEKVKDDFAQKCIAVWREYAPNMDADNILAVHPYTPLDIAQKMVNMRRGGFHTLSLTPEQFDDKRPVPELSDFRTPIEGLYLAGSAMHCHGGIVGSPSYNALQVLGQDFDFLDKMPIGNKFWEKK